MAWVHHYQVTLPQSQYCLGCTRVTGFLRLADQPELTALAAPHCATLMVVGERDRVRGRDDGASATAGARETYARARRVYEMFGVPEKLQLIVVPEGGHRPPIANRDHRLFRTARRSPVRGPGGRGLGYNRVHAQ
jgi:pimeloyl-ACP methyl ester carboxylesterase